MDKPIILGLVLVAVAAMGTMGLITASANADKTLTCDTTKDCNVIIRKLKVGDDLIIQFKASPPSGSTGGGGGTAPAATVDQQARDDISELKSVDVTHGNELSRLTTENTALKGNLTAMIDKVTAQGNDIETLKAQVANISAVNPIVDINVTHPGQNVTEPVPEPVPVPPVENNTTPIPPIENNTIPPIDNGTIPIPPIDNQTGSGNGTIPTPPIDNGTVVVTPPNDNGTVIVNPPAGNETTVTPPTNGTVIVTPPGNETSTGNETNPNPIPANDTGFTPAPNSTEPVVNPLQ